MTEAAAALPLVDQRVGLETPGIGVVVVPPGEQAKHAEVLARAPGRALVEFGSLRQAGTTPVLVVPGLPEDPRSAATALATFNGMRNLLGAAGYLVVLVLSRRELSWMQQHAPDAYSVRHFVMDIPFVPDPTVDAEAARGELARWQRERFGRLDLRGFVRSETEDVSWQIEDIYQDIKATDALFWEGGVATQTIGASVVDSLAEWHSHSAKDDGPVVILGHPGSGKTFFLRWLALRAATEPVFVEIEQPVPFLTSLSAYAESPGPVSLYDYMIEMLLQARQPAAHVVARSVEARRAIFLFDGLDEVGAEPARRRMVEAIGALRERAPGCLIVITSRISGYDATVLPGARHLMLSPFDDAAVRGFLIRWCELYAVDRAGDSAHSRREGRVEGEQLARDVLAHKDVRELSRNPLLLTVLAIVHRAGVRLPDHRIELYEHATKVLVERWNRVRSLTQSRPPPPLKATDAVRLLGPVALRMVRSGSHGVISEADLRQMLDKALSGGALRGVATTDEAIALFRNALGLLVEQGPGVYAFIHLTLAEYFAAWELVRSNELEALVEREIDVFYPQWREVILLAAGELGVIRADDARLEDLITRLLDSASRRPGKPSATVPSLLGGLLADDPGLTQGSIDEIVRALVPTWWFTRGYGASSSLDLAVSEAIRLVRDRIQGGRAAEPLRGEISRCYAQGLDTKIYKNLARGGPAVLARFLQFLAAADVDNGPSFMSCVRAGKVGQDAVLKYWIPVIDAKFDGGAVIGRVSLSQIIDKSVRDRLLSARLHYILRWGVRGRVFRLSRGVCEWSRAESTGDGAREYVRVELRVPITKPAGMTLVSGSIRIEILGPPRDGGAPATP
jgi:NACHT domain